MNNDLISRKALKKATRELYKETPDGIVKFGIGKVYDLIDTAPTVEVSENSVNCVLTVFGTCSYNETGCSDCEIRNKILKALSVRPQGEWVPVSERLPDDRENTYWVCTDSEYQCQCRWTNVVPFCTNHKADWHWWHFDIPQYQEVIAWQPLPEPYQKGGAE